MVPGVCAWWIKHAHSLPAYVPLLFFVNSRGLVVSFACPVGSRAGLDLLECDDRRRLGGAQQGDAHVQDRLLGERAFEAN